MSTIVASLFCIPTSNVCQFLLIHTPIITWCCNISISSLSIAVYLYLSVVLTCHSPITYEAEHLFICLLAICIYSLVRCLFRSFDHFLNRGFHLLSIDLIVIFIFWIIVFYQVCLLQIFSPFCGLSSHSLDNVFHRVEVLNFNEVHLNYFFHHKPKNICTF